MDVNDELVKQLDTDMTITSTFVQDRIVVFDDSLLNLPGPRLVSGLELLAKTIHPELFR